VWRVIEEDMDVGYGENEIFCCLNVDYKTCRL
jgi:hypothetical protein